MNMPNSEDFQDPCKILLGIESIYPEKSIIPKVRFAIETLSCQKENGEKVLSDFFVILKNIKSYPVTPIIESLVMAKDSKVLLVAVLKLLDHLTYKTIFEDFRMIVAHLNLEGDPKNLRNLIVKFLNERSKEKGSEFCSSLVDIILEQESSFKVKKILKFYEFLYDDEALISLQKSYEHFLSLKSPLQFYAFLHSQLDLPILNGIKVLQYQGSSARLSEALSKGQIYSKRWVVETLESLNLDLQSALVLCGWYGVLPYMLFENGYQHIVSVDRDPNCEAIAYRLNKWRQDHGHFLPVTGDIFDIDYNQLSYEFTDDFTVFESADIMINTSCEHIEDFQRWYDKIPDGQLLLLQSNDFFECEEHVNCVNSTSEFREQTPMRKRLFSGALPLEKYTRYMVIGYK